MSQAYSLPQAPIFSSDASFLSNRILYDFRDYGFELRSSLDNIFKIIPTVVSDQECFIFFFPNEDISNNRWSLLNVHVFLKRIGSIEDFAHSLGESVRQVILKPEIAFGNPAQGYSRTIAIGDLFKGNESVIAFLGADPKSIARDSHYYFLHHHNHCYTGLIHLVGDEFRYDELRSILFKGVRFID